MVWKFQGRADIVPIMKTNTPIGAPSRRRSGDQVPHLVALPNERETVFERVVVALDTDSDRSERVVEAAEQLARVANGAVLVAHIQEVERPAVIAATPRPGAIPPPLPADSSREAQALVDRAVDRLQRAGLHAEGIVRPGTGSTRARALADRRWVRRDGHRRRGQRIEGHGSTSWRRRPQDRPRCLVLSAADSISEECEVSIAEARSTVSSSPSSSDSSGKTVRSLVPARHGPLPWTRFHWLVICGLGVSWILDGLEIQIVATVGTVLQDRGTLHLTTRRRRAHRLGLPARRGRGRAASSAASPI